LVTAVLVFYNPTIRFSFPPSTLLGRIGRREVVLLAVSSGHPIDGFRECGKTLIGIRGT
jgi:hypothetical protein